MHKNTTTSFAFSSIHFDALSRVAANGQRGFSLIELMIVVAVATVLLGFGIPSMTALMNSNKLTSATNALMSSMRLARSEAFKRNSRVVVCKSRDGVTCTPTGGWEQGWLVFHDTNADGVHDENEVIIERGNPLPATVRLTGNSTVGKYISFVASGSTRLMGGGFQAGTLTVCNLSLEAGEARQIVLNAVGRLRVQKVAVPICA